MELDVLMQAIGSIGFPCAICIYTLVMNNKTIKGLSDTIAENTNVMKQILEHFRVVKE